MSIAVRAAVPLLAAALTGACTSDPPATETGAVATAAVPLPTRAPAKPKTPASHTLPGVAEAAAPASATAELPAPTSPGSLMAQPPAEAPQGAAPGSLFAAGTAQALPGVTQPSAPGAIGGGMELRGALPAVAGSTVAPEAAASDPNLPGVAQSPVQTAAAGQTAPPDARFGANPPSATALRGSWRLQTTSSNVSCVIAVSPAEQRSAGDVSAQKECRAYGAVNRFELRGRDLVLIDPFGETATLTPLGAYWQGRGKDGEGIILQR